MYRILDRVEYPSDLKKLTIAELKELAQEVRSYIIETVSKTGGHLSSSLGCVELTLAIHYVFNTPEDKLIWDVGHQSYAHKILTGRKERMSSLRSYHGLSGFPRIEESPYDAFGTGHSSTSISATLAMAVAAKARGETARSHIAVIGDGAMTAGMAFEALNCAGDMKDLKLLVILNDNDCSISPPVGGLSKHFTRLMSGQFYAQARDLGKSIVRPFPKLFQLTKRAEEYSKGMVAPNSTLFEEFGLNYHGPIDGHDLDALIPVLQNMKELRGPLVLHVVTQKGFGYAPAEHNPTKYHGITPFDSKIGLQSKPHAPTFTEVFSQWICHKASEDKKLIAITPAMKEGSGLVEFAKEFPGRFFDVAIAEQHAATFAAGLAVDGMKPVLALYSTFAQRAYDQIIHDICIQNLPVLIALDRGGLVGADGPTHHGAMDISFLRCIPNLTIAVPSDENECWHLLETAYSLNSPAVVRYPRGKGMQVTIARDNETYRVGKSRILRLCNAETGHRVAFFAFGPITSVALMAAETLDATVCDMRFVKPLDTETILALAATHDLLVTIEENTVMGGAGSAVSEVLFDHGVMPRMLHFGLPDRFVPHGSQEELLKECGLDADSVVCRIRDELFS